MEGVVRELSTAEDAALIAPLACPAAPGAGGVGALVAEFDADDPGHAPPPVGTFRQICRDVLEQREEVLPPEHGQRLPPALLQDEERGETLCCRVSGALLPPRRQGDPVPALCTRRRSRTARERPARGRGRNRTAPIAVDKMSPGSMPRRSTRSHRTACCSRRPLALREAGVFAVIRPPLGRTSDLLKCCLCLVDLVILDHDVVVGEGPCRVWCEGRRNTYSSKCPFYNQDKTPIHSA